jgi:hypothetical protein
MPFVDIRVQLPMERGVAIGMHTRLLWYVQIASIECAQVAMH